MRVLLAATIACAIGSSASAQTPPNGSFNNLTANTISGSGTTPNFNIDASGNAAFSTINANTGVLVPGNSTVRSILQRFIEHVDVRDFGAKCDGSTADDTAFQSAIAYALGNAPKNSAYEIDIPAGRCILTQTLTVNYGQNTSLRFHGDGSSHTELQFNGGVNGFYINFAANNQGNDFSRQGSWLGQGIAIDGIHFLANTGSGDVGTAVSVIGIPILGSTNPPFQIYSDLEFGNSGGYTDRANNWAGAIYLQDADNVYMDRVQFWDHNLLSNTTTRAFWIHSTGPATQASHNNINLSYVLVAGGNTGIQIDGNGIQGVNITHASTVDTNVGISWIVAAPNSFAGSLTIDHSSLQGDSAIVETQNVNTIFSGQNFYYNTTPSGNTSFYGLEVLGGSTVSSVGDTFVGPAAGQLKGQTSTAVYITSPMPYFNQGSVVTGDNVNGFDRGYVASGGPLVFTADKAAIETGTCYLDTGTQSDTRLHPVFDQMFCGQQLVHDDSQSLTYGVNWVTQAYENGSLELGLPGIVTPAGVTGSVGQIDFHSTPASSISGLNDYDARIRPGPGVAGTSGMASLNVFDSFTQFQSPVLTNDLRYIGFTVPATQSASCNTGDSGDGVLSGVYYHFYCASTNKWTRVALSTTSW